MRLPLPNTEELDHFLTLYAEQIGVRPDLNEGYDAFSRLVQLVYLLEYEPVRPLREDDWTVERMLLAKQGKLKSKELRPPEDLLAWYDQRTGSDRDELLDR